ncbi:hypothetical protein KSF_035810 [Reticulibacter mediterranei]|uniref:DNA2/NAM7 helicase helicase domain-containing protein n=1 Tax=Reticulibacter mediterranei TaxID=2778369 RepID=A0A8J3N2J2_9CHLR|nr:AAA domain-containing protein [Reticulibacter mediterranei]GHO93533.1 hypothetical protein KSF_035810 [Reticulibacter mediterranei]
MNKRTVTIGPVFLVISASVAQALQASQKDYPHLPDSTQLEVDMNLLNDQSGVPAVVADNEQNPHKLFLYTPSYSLELDEIEETKNGYRIKQIEPVNVQMYDRLAQGSLSLSATRWHLCTQEKEIPSGQSSHWQVIEKEWQLLQEQIEQLRELARRDAAPVLAHSLLPSQHERYLDLAASLLELTHSLKNETNEVLLSAQQAAVALLREGKAANPYLLTVLVDHSYQPYEEATIPLVAGELSSEQEEILQKGLSVPDLLLIHTAPAAEHIKAIAELIHACSAKKQHVLLATSTEQRLEDVLGRLPDELLSLRLDQQEDELSTNSTGARPVKAWARQMRRQILEKTEAALPPLSRLVVSKKTIDQWIERLQRHMATLSDEATKQQVSLLRQRMSTIEQFISTPFMPTLLELAAAVQQLEENLAQQKNRLETFNERQKPALGRLFHGVDQLAQGWLKRQQGVVDSLQAEYEAKKRMYQQAQETMLQIVRDDLEYVWCQQRIQEIEAEYATALAEATKAATILQDTVRELVPVQPPLEPFSELTLQHYLNWYTVTRALLEQRHDLLQEWRSQLSKYAEIVYPELLRYADVVGGTYSDIVAAKELTKITYDLVIVEDAGGMVLPDLLPLLVKARRAVLVGNPDQVTPFDKEAVQAVLQTCSDAEQTPEITIQLTSSVFAQLWSSPIDAAHTVCPAAPVQEGAEPVEKAEENSAPEEVRVNTSPLPAEEGKEELPPDQPEEQAVAPDEQSESARIESARIEEEVI